MDNNKLVRRSMRACAGRWGLAVFFGVGTLLAAYLLVEEATSSRLQARYFTGRAGELSFRTESGASAAIRFPSEGPFDQRLGYSRIPTYLQRLQAQGYAVDVQARLSPAMLALAERGYFLPYREKTNSGLDVLGCRGEPLFFTRHPERRYASFEEIPPLVIQALLYIENRDLLDAGHPARNPALDAPRLAKALMSQSARLLHQENGAPGASTLATQIEKYRHSPGGVTGSAREKFRQMMSASFRAYLDGEDTLAARRRIVLDYLNTVPLAAFPGYGEVHGLGDGLWAWLGADFELVNRDLSVTPYNASALAAQGRALRQVLMLMIAQRRPSYYLGTGREQLGKLTDQYLLLLERAGVIAPELHAAARYTRLHFRDPAVDAIAPRHESSKAAALVRHRLATLLDEPLYRLDRLDLTVTSSLDRELQEAVGAALQRMTNPEHARTAGLLGPQLLSRGDPSRVRYSLVLMERGADANHVRVQTDNSNQPLDINEGTKLELGSTAKLRTLATYLDLVASLHQRFATLEPKELATLELHPRDTLGRWAKAYLAAARDKSLAAMLEAALERRYSASPHEVFFTGGGLHQFENFQREDDARHPTVREALRQSINLAFVRLMRDIVQHHIHGGPRSTSHVLDRLAPEERTRYLERFADQEGRVFLQRFYRKYRGRTRPEMLQILLAGARPAPQRLAVVHRALEPDADFEAFGHFIKKTFSGSAPAPADKVLAELYQRYAPGSYSLPDQGYLAGVHPLELWVAAYLYRHPSASLAQLVAASAAERREVYGWLFRSRHKGAQDRRILSLLEAEAFVEVHQQWKKLGYPFDYLVPSYATALGSSGDRPAALAELMGIILNDGVRLPTMRLQTLHFAEGTPYETRLQNGAGSGQRVLAKEVAVALRRALAGVVEAGTAKRLDGVFRYPNGSALVVGGKTGTGDNRIETVGAKGQPLRSRAVNRTATFAFFIGERYFGTLTAYVVGAESEHYQFTSALPVQVLKSLAPQMIAYMDPRQPPRCGDKHADRHFYEFGAVPSIGLRQPRQSIGAAVSQHAFP